MAGRSPLGPDDLNIDIEELNADHFVSSEGGSVRIYTERFDPALNRDVLDRSSASDFRLLYSNRFVWSERQTKDGIQRSKIPLGVFWLAHQDRRQYREILFNPDPKAKNDSGVYNLWRGFAVEPADGDWSVWREHLFNIGANGDPDTYEFILDWFAWMMRYPHRPAETVIVWRGKQGSGKGTIARIMGQVVGQHFVHVYNVKHLVGNFNAHLRDALLVFSDEALWAGDKAGEGILKAMITEPTLLLEPKGRDVYSVPNRIHLLMATNNDWAAPVSVDDRRFCMVDVPDTHIGDEKYFDRLYDSMKNGGLAAFVKFLLARPVNRPPKPPRSVSALASALTQKLHSMPPAWQWWYEKMESGQLLKTEEGWPESVSRFDLHEDLLKFAEQINLSRRASETILGMYLKEMLPWLRSERRFVAGDAKRARVWVLPPLEDCRKHFAEALKMPGLFDALRD
jgi:hypothetical protein